MTLQTMEYFIKLAEYSSFTVAAKELYVSQPTLSRQIRDLEAELGILLIVRGEKKPIRLTPEGEIFLAEARKIVDHVNCLPEIIQKKNHQHFSISIGYHSTFNSSLLHKTVADCSRQQSDIRIDLKCCSSNSLTQGLHDGTFDIIFISEFCMESLFDSVIVPISGYDLRVAVSAQHPLANRRSIQLSSLKDENFLFLERQVSQISLDRMISLCVENGFSPKVVKWFQDKPTLLVSIGAGNGISLTLSGSKIPSTVRLIPLSEPKIKGNYCAVYRKSNSNPAIGEFLSVLEENIHP